MKWKFCPQCGIEFRPEWQHCPQCGAVIGTIQAQIHVPSVWDWPTSTSRMLSSITTTPPMGYSGGWCYSDGIQFGTAPSTTWATVCGVDTSGKSFGHPATETGRSSSGLPA